MRARMNRKILLSYLKSMVRVVPQSNSIMELMGFMIKCNEDEGVVYITLSPSFFIATTSVIQPVPSCAARRGAKSFPSSVEPTNTASGLYFSVRLFII